MSSFDLCIVDKIVYDSECERHVNKYQERELNFQVT